MQPQSSTAPTTMEVRPPKFLHGFGRAQGSPKAVPEPWNRSDRAQPPTISPLGPTISLTRGHPGIYTPDLCPALRKCPYGATNTPARSARRIFERLLQAQRHLFIV